jgi:uncharacterized protein (UPF0333 family)
MKGQAALEFMLTYGWAVLIVVVVIAALFWMNVFNPAAFIKDDANAVECYEKIVLNDTDEHCNTTCTCEIVCLNIDNETAKQFRDSQK